MSPSGDGDVGEASRFASSVRTEQSETLRLHIEPFRSPEAECPPLVPRVLGRWPKFGPDRADAVRSVDQESFPSRRSRLKTRPTVRLVRRTDGSHLKAVVPTVRKPAPAPGSPAPLAFRDGPQRLSGLLERSARMNLRPLRETKNALTVIFVGCVTPLRRRSRPQRERPIKA
jgi:hypothetical protein